MICTLSSCKSVWTCGCMCTHLWLVVTFCEVRRKRKKYPWGLPGTEKLLWYHTTRQGLRWVGAPRVWAKHRSMYPKLYQAHLPWVIAFYTLHKPSALYQEGVLEGALKALDNNGSCCNFYWKCRKTSPQKCFSLWWSRVEPVCLSSSLASHPAAPLHVRAQAQVKRAGILPGTYKGILFPIDWGHKMLMRVQLLSQV